MTQGGYLAIAIVVLIILLATFIVTFVIYRRTPVPKGCEEMKMDEEKCSSCGHSECHFYKGEDKE